MIPELVVPDLTDFKVANVKRLHASIKFKFLAVESLRFV